MNNIFSKIAAHFEKENPDLSQLTNDEVRKLWDDKKQKLLLKISFATAVAVVGGIDLLFEQNIGAFLQEKILSKSPVYGGAADAAKELFMRAPSEAQAPQNDGFVTQALAYGPLLALGTLLSWITLSNKDPLSNAAFIRNFHEGDAGKYLSFPFSIFSSSLKYFAQVSPSNLLSNHCSKCAQTNCVNRISIGHRNARDHWLGFTAQIDKQHLFDHLSALYSIRRLFYTKFLAIWTAILVAFFGILSELYNLSQPVTERDDVGFGFGSLTIIICAITVAFICHCVTSLQREEPQKALSRFESSTHPIFNSGGYAKIHENVVCRLGGCETRFLAKNFEDWEVYWNRHEDVSLGLREFVNEFQARQFNIEIDFKRVDIEYLNRLLPNIMTAILELFVYLHPQDNFRVTFFASDKQAGYLKPIYRVTSSEKSGSDAILKNTNIGDNKVHYSFTGSSAVSTCWQSERIVCQSGTQINYFSAQQENIVRSVMVCPVGISDVAINQLKKRSPYKELNNIDDVRKAGVVAIDTDSLYIFDERNVEINQILTQALVHNLATQFCNWEISQMLSKDYAPNNKV